MKSKGSKGKMKKPSGGMMAKGKGAKGAKMAPAPQLGGFAAKMQAAKIAKSKK